LGKRGVTPRVVGFGGFLRNDFGIWIHGFFREDFIWFETLVVEILL